MTNRYKIPLSIHDNDATIDIVDQYTLILTFHSNSNIRRTRIYEINTGRIYIQNEQINYEIRSAIVMGRQALFVKTNTFRMPDYKDGIIRTAHFYKAIEVHNISFDSFAFSLINRSDTVIKMICRPNQDELQTFKGFKFLGCKDKTPTSTNASDWL